MQEMMRNEMNTSKTAPSSIIRHFNSVSDCSLVTSRTAELAHDNQHRVNRIENLCIASWNINGLGDKQDSLFHSTKSTDDIFLKRIAGCDLVFLLETHCDENEHIDIPGFITRNFNKHDCKQNGNIDGGIAILVKPHIMQGVSLIDTTNRDYIWLKLDRNFFGLEKDIYVCCAYLPHERSCYIDKHELDIVDVIESEIEKYSKDGYIYFVGDLNGRCASLLDFIENDSDDDFDDHYLITIT